MKFGILYNKYNSNIGDDIQALATSYFLPTVDCFVDREYIDEFVPDDGEPIAVLMNAWYMWRKWHWPPSKYIVPKFVGFHYADHQLAKQPGSSIKYEFLNGLGGEYLKAYGPIGARDLYTLHQLQEIGIDSYFSGCITLTLPKQKKIKTNKYICIVDVEPKVREKIKNDLKGSGIEIKVITHFKEKDENVSWEDKKKSCINLLTTYQNALCVVTKRLHCALPCLAMEVPVLLVKEMEDDIRFTPYYDFLHRTNPKNFLKGMNDYDLKNPPNNKDLYRHARDELIRTCTEFVSKMKDENRSADELNKFTYSDDEVMRWRHDTMKAAMDSWFLFSKQIQKENMVLKKTNNTLKKQNSDLKKGIIKKGKPIQKRLYTYLKQKAKSVLR